MTSQANTGAETARYESQTRYVFTHADTGEILRQYLEESYTPIPEVGSRVVVGETLARPDENGGWDSSEQNHIRLVVTDVEYEYNSVMFESDDGSARRLITQVWIYAIPVSEESRTEE